jgi:hypothetical protein
MIMIENDSNQERKKMNKTIKIIAIVFLVLGALALIGGAVYGLAGRRMMSGNIPAMDRQNMPSFKGGGNGWDGRGQSDGMPPFGRRGFFGFPLWMAGGGLTFLIAGAVLLIFNKKFASSVETPAAPVKEPAKKAASAKASQLADSKKPAAKKPGK